MRQTHKAIGILGGTFDPIHLGHLRMALELREAFDLDKIHIIPCYQPVHREIPIATPEERLTMVQYAIGNEPTLVADPREINRRQSSYSIDTILELRQEMPHTTLCLLLGIDAFLGFPTWHRFQDILDNAHLVVAHRPHYQLPSTGIIADLLKERLRENTPLSTDTVAGGIWLQSITALEISSSYIRKQISMERNPRYLLPDMVYQYIQQYQIYHTNRISL